MQWRPCLLVLCELLTVDDYRRLTPQQFESSLLQVLYVFPKDNAFTLPSSQKECYFIH
jgi:hypothetical protein